MSQKAILRIAQGTVLLSLLIMLFVFIYVVLMGVRHADRVFHRAEAVSMEFAVSALIFGVKYCAVEWKDRPDKQPKLRALKLLAIFAVIIGIPTVAMNWFFS